MKNIQKHIGILGLGTRSTLFYLQELNKRYHEKTRYHHTFPCIVYYIDFDTLNPFLPNQFNKIIPILKTHLDALFSLPIKLGIIPNITLHEAFDLAKFNYTIAHPINLAIKHIKENKLSEVTLFGSKYTVQSNYIKSIFKNENIDVHTPHEEDIETIDLLRQKIYIYKETQDDIEVYKNLIKYYSENSSTLIACTELSILNSKISSQMSVIDLALLQIQEALNHSNQLEIIKH